MNKTEESLSLYINSSMNRQSLIFTWYELARANWFLSDNSILFVSPYKCLEVLDKIMDLYNYGVMWEKMLFMKHSGNKCPIPNWKVKLCVRSSMMACKVHFHISSSHHCNEHSYMLAPEEEGTMHREYLSTSLHRGDERGEDVSFFSSLRHLQFYPFSLAKGHGELEFHCSLQS